ncbi:hypothetical protein Tco_0574891 [Tanacetum coccineum]
MAMCKMCKNDSDVSSMLIMAASAIAISSDSSDESVRSPPSRVIFVCDIPTVIPSTSVVAPETSTIAPVISSAAPVVEKTLVTSPTGLCGLVPYSGSDSDSPDEMTLCASRCSLESRVTIHPSSSSEFPIAPVTAPPRIRQRSAILIRLGEAIPFGRPYRTHLNGPHAPDQTHFGSLTRVVPPRLCYPPRRAPRRSKAFLHWCAAPLSTLYPPTTSESSSGDSSERPLHSSSPSAGPSRKRFRSLVDFVPSSTPVGIDSMSAPIVKEEIVKPAGEDSSGTRDGIVRSFEDMPIDLNDAVRDFYYHMSEVRIDRIVEIKTVQRRLEAGRLMAKGQRVSMIKRIDSLRLENLKVYAMLDIKRDHVNSLRLHMRLFTEGVPVSFSEDRVELERDLGG